MSLLDMFGKKSPLVDCNAYLSLRRTDDGQLTTESLSFPFPSR